MPIKWVMHVARIVENKTNALGVGTETGRKKGHFEDLVMDGIILLNLFAKKNKLGGLRNRTSGGKFELCTEPSVYMKVGKFLENLRNYWLYNKDCALCS
jgi:hypothetical protein